MPNAQPEVTVVIPSKDRPILVNRAVRAALGQDGVDVEVIVVDDGSAPPVSLDDADARLRVLRNEHSQGVSAARNRAVAEARAPWVAFLDDDDLWSPRKLRRQLDALREHEGQWCFAGAYCLTSELDLRFEMPPPFTWTSEQALRKTNVVGSPSGVLASTELVRAAGGFDGTFATFADWDLWLRLADHEPALAVREPLVGYVTHSGSMHRQGLRPYLREYRQFRSRHRDRGRIGAPELWEWLADTKRDEQRPALAVAIALGAAARWRRLGVARRAVRHVIRPEKPGPVPWPTGTTPDWIASWQTAADGEAPRSA